MRKVDTMLKEYISKLNNDSLRLLGDQLECRLNGDLADALDFMSKNQELDHWLKSAKSCDELYDMIDTTQEYVFRECNKRVPELVRG